MQKLKQNGTANNERFHGSGLPLSVRICGSCSYSPGSIERKWATQMWNSPEEWHPGAASIVGLLPYTAGARKMENLCLLVMEGGWGWLR